MHNEVGCIQLASRRLSVPGPIYGRPLRVRLASDRLSTGAQLASVEWVRLQDLKLKLNCIMHASIEYVMYVNGATIRPDSFSIKPYNALGFIRCRTTSDIERTAPSQEQSSSLLRR